MQFTVVQRTWTHQPAAGDVDHRGTLRWCVLDDGFVYDHYATEAEATTVADAMNTRIDPVTGDEYTD